MMLTSDLKAMGDTDVMPVKLHHKEEDIGRIKQDSHDRKSIRENLSMCIDPLNPSSHRSGLLLNIVTGKIASPEVNVDKALHLGHSILSDFEASWPQGFYNPIPKKVITFDDSSKKMKINGQVVPNPETVYQRVIGVMISDRNLDIREVFGTELNTHPTAMFKEDGTMRFPENKSTLKNIIQVEIPANFLPTPTVLVIDASQYLWTIEWPTSGRIEAIAMKVKNNIEDLLKHSDVYLVFDRYKDYSIKSNARMPRASMKEDIL